MVGKRWSQLATAGLMALAVGCSNSRQAQTTSGMSTTLPGQGESRWSSLFGSKPPGPTPTDTGMEIVDRSSKKKGVSPETHVTFAKVQVDAAFFEGRSSQETDQLLDHARQRYQKVLNTDPTNAEALRGLAELYTRAGDRDKALQLYQTLVEAHPKDHKAAHEMALACARFDEWNAAIGACEYALSLDPENRRYRKTLGKCQAWAGDYERAYESLASVMREPEARTTLGRLMVEAGHAEMGRQQLQYALAVDANYAPAQEALAAMNGQVPQGVPAQGDIRQTGYQPGYDR